MPKQFVTFCTTNDLQAGQREIFDVGRLSILLLNIDGEYFAIENLCSHEEYELSDGLLEGCSLECSQHGAAFDLRTGEALSPPAYAPVKIFATRLQDDDVQVELDLP